MVEPATLTVSAVLKGATTAVQLAKAAGLMRTATDRLLDAIAADVRSLIEAPFHEGLSRLESAASTSDPARRAMYLAEARAKFQDVAARPRAPRHLVALACVYCAGLTRVEGHEEEAQDWMRQALDAFDAWLSSAHRDAEAAIQALSGRRASIAWEMVRTGFNPLGRAVEETPRLLKYRSAVGRLPSSESIEEVNHEVGDAIAFAAALGVDTGGRCCRLSLRWRWRGLLVGATLTKV